MSRVPATVRLLARAATLGLAVGVLAVPALVLVGWSADRASAVAFSLAALVFGFGLAAWATTLLLGTTLSAMAETVDADWTVAGTRQAMAVLAALGGGAMVGTALATAVLDAAAALT